MSESDLFRTKQTHERNRVQGRIPTDRLGYSLSQIAEVKWFNFFFWFSYILFFCLLSKKKKGGTQSIRIETRIWTSFKISKIRGCSVRAGADWRFQRFIACFLGRDDLTAEGGTWFPNILLFVFCSFLKNNKIFFVSWSQLGRNTNKRFWRK